MSDPKRAFERVVVELHPIGGGAPVRIDAVRDGIEDVSIEHRAEMREVEPVDSHVRREATGRRSLTLRLDYLTKPFTGLIR